MVPDSIVQAVENFLALITFDLVLQLGLFVLVLFIALALRPTVAQLLARWQEWISGLALTRFVSWLTHVIPIALAGLFPLLAWILGSAARAILAEAGRPTGVLDWLVPFLLFWLLYSLAVALVARRATEERARFWERRIFRPLLLGVILLHIVGLFHRLLDLGFRVGDSVVTIGGLLAGAVVFYIFYTVAFDSRRVLRRFVLPKAGFDPSLTQALAVIAAYALLLAGLLISLRVIGIPLTAFTVIAGGLAVGLGFGLQELVSNFVSGFILLFEGSIAPGNVIEVGDTFGTVEDVGLRSTRVRNRDNVELIVPNSRFLNEEVVNFTRSDSRVRLRISVGVSYNEQPRAVERALLAAANHPLVLSDPEPTVQFMDFGDNSLDFDLLVWTNDPLRRGRIRSDLRYQIWDALQEQGMEIPFPQRDLHIRSVTAPANGGLWPAAPPSE